MEEFEIDPNDPIAVALKQQVKEIEDIRAQMRECQERDHNFQEGVQILSGQLKESERIIAEYNNRPREAIAIQKVQRLLK